MLKPQEARNIADGTENTLTDIATYRLNQPQAFEYSSRMPSSCPPFCVLSSFVLFLLSLWFVDYPFFLAEFIQVLCVLLNTPLLLFKNYLFQQMLKADHETVVPSKREDETTFC